MGADVDLGDHCRRRRLEVDDLEAQPLVLAQHYELGGESSRAVSWYRRAAEQALVAANAAPFDLIFIDADKGGYPAYLEWSLNLSRPGTVIVADNVVRDGKVIDPESADPNVQGVRRFTDLVSAESRLSATVVQTVGSKGYDGFAIAIVLR